MYSSVSNTLCHNLCDTVSTNVLLLFDEIEIVAGMLWILLKRQVKRSFEYCRKILRKWSTGLVTLRIDVKCRYLFLIHVIGPVPRINIGNVWWQNTRWMKRTAKNGRYCGSDRIERLPPSYFLIGDQQVLFPLKKKKKKGKNSRKIFYPVTNGGWLYYRP